TSEAFLHAVADENQLKQSNDSLLVFSLIYLILNVLLIRTADMIFRIIYSAIFIRKYFKSSQDLSFSFRACLPGGSLLLLVSGVATFILQRVYLNKDNFWSTFTVHMSFGLACFSVAAFVIYQKEKPFINKILRFREHAD
ncbi:nuclear division RFT1-like protein, partial [Striga asiatica]